MPSDPRRGAATDAKLAGDDRSAEDDLPNGVSQHNSQNLDDSLSFLSPSIYTNNSKYFQNAPQALSGPKVGAPLKTHASSTGITLARVHLAAPARVVLHSWVPLAGTAHCPAWVPLAGPVRCPA